MEISSKEDLQRKLVKAMRRRDNAWDKVRKLPEYRAYRKAESAVEDLCDQHPYR